MQEFISGEAGKWASLFTLVLQRVVESNAIKSNHVWLCHLLFGCAVWHGPNANDAIGLSAAHYGPRGASQVLQPSRRRKLEGANGSLVRSCGYHTSHKTAVEIHAIFRLQARVCGAHMREQGAAKEDYGVV